MCDCKIPQVYLNKPVQSKHRKSKCTPPWMHSVGLERLRELRFMELRLHRFILVNLVV